MRLTICFFFLLQNEKFIFFLHLQWFHSIHTEKYRYLNAKYVFMLFLILNGYFDWGQRYLQWNWMPNFWTNKIEPMYWNGLRCEMADKQKLKSKTITVTVTTKAFCHNGIEEKVKFVCVFFLFRMECGSNVHTQSKLNRFYKAMVKINLTSILDVLSDFLLAGGW